jgi:carbonic anhydrase
MRLSKTLIIGSLLYSIGAFAKSMPEGKLQMLLEGNARYVQDTPLHPNRGKEQRGAVSLKQNPYAVIVGCSDSRAAPELIFDQGIGDLFVVRVAGNVVGPLELDSIEYSVVYLGSSVILVLGHENCGAVDAVIHGQTKDIESVAALIEPAAEKTKDIAQNRLYETTVQNALRMKEFLLKSKVLKKYVKKGKLQIYAGYYNFESGKVDIL